VDVQIHVFSTSAIFASEWSVSRTGRFTHGTHWIGGWVGTRTGVEYVERRKILPLPELELQPLGRPSRSQSLYRLTWAGSPEVQKSNSYDLNDYTQEIRMRHCSSCAIAQEVSHRLPTSTTRVPSQIRSCGFCGGQSGTGADLLLVRLSPVPILIPPTAPYSLIILS
jgi:hypothetical protein